MGSYSYVVLQMSRKYLGLHTSAMLCQALHGSLKGTYTVFLQSIVTLGLAFFRLDQMDLFGCFKL